jgi:hypothetical protein
VLFSCPFQVSLDDFMLCYFVEGVEFPAQMLFGKLLMQKRMTAPADINAPLLHLAFGKVFSEPFVTMTGSGNKMVEGN